jgi:hypothetical protein
MRKFISVFILCLALLCSTIYAAVPLDNFMEIKDGRHIITKTYEATTAEDPSLLIEETFEQDGFSYTYYETVKEEIPKTESRQETQTATVTTADDDMQNILQHFAPEIEYSGDDGFKGKLLIDHATLVTEAEGYVSKSFTLTDTKTVMGLSSNDPSSIPKSTVKSGVTLTLKNIDWSAQATEAVDYNTVSTMYQATAHYSGSYSKQMPTGFISTAEYKGEVTKTQVEKTIFSLIYIGTEIPEPTPAPLPTPAPVPETETTDNNPLLFITAGIIAASLLTASVIFYLFYYLNTIIYIKNGDEYSLLTRKHINGTHPVVDLTGLDLAGKEVAVNVKKAIACKLFGRHIATIANDGFSIKCLVDKQGCDFWYVINVPNKTVEATE